MHMTYLKEIQSRVKEITEDAKYLMSKIKSILHSRYLKTEVHAMLVEPKREKVMNNVSLPSNVFFNKDGTPAKVALFSAGLGDVIRVMYQTNHYKHICEATEPVHVIVASHNPFTMEIFKFHRNAHNFILYDLGHKYEECIRSEVMGTDITNTLYGFIGASRANFIHGRNDTGFKPMFDAPDEIHSKGHIIFQPYAGSHDARTFKPEFIEKIISVLRKQKKTVYILTRSYIRKGISGKVVHNEENAKQYEGGNIVVLDNLSVPAALNLVKNSSGYVGTWSSMQQMAWFENKPVAVFYQPNNTDVVNRTGYAFGLDREDCLHCDYPSFDSARFEAWVDSLK